MINEFEKYMRYELNYSAHTVLSYISDLKLFESWLAASGQCADTQSAGEAQIRLWIINRSSSGDGVTTIRRRLQSLRAYYRFLIKRGLLASNPAREIETAKAPKKLPSYVREQNMDKLLDEAIDEDDFTAVRDRLIVMLFYTTGIRRAELISLEDANVDTASMELKVHGKRNKDRVVPFGPELKEWIDRYRRLRAKTIGLSHSDTFFTRCNGEALYPSLVYKVVHDSLLEAGGCSKQSPHTLRHTFASAMLNGGANLNSVKELLGHESLAATQLYTHLAFGELKSNYEQAHPRALKKEVL